MFKIVESPCSTSDSDIDESCEEKETRPKVRLRVGLRKSARASASKKLEDSCNDILIGEPDLIQLDCQQPQVDKDTEINKLMKKSVIKPGFEKNVNFTPVIEGKRAAKRLGQEKRSRTKGCDWFDMPATEMTEERKRDLEIIQHRHVLDPKTFYKSNDSKTLPKYYQIGTVVDSYAQFYDRVPKKARHRTIADELLADFQMQQKFKKKYKDIQAEKYKNKPKTFFKKAKKKGSAAV